MHWIHPSPYLELWGKTRYYPDAASTWLYPTCIAFITMASSENTKRQLLGIIMKLIKFSIQRYIASLYDIQGRSKTPTTFIEKSLRKTTKLSFTMVTKQIRLLSSIMCFKLSWQQREPICCVILVSSEWVSESAKWPPPD